MLYFDDHISLQFQRINTSLPKYCLFWHPLVVQGLQSDLGHLNQRTILVRWKGKTPMKISRVTTSASSELYQNPLSFHKVTKVWVDPLSYLHDKRQHYHLSNQWIKLCKFSLLMKDCAVLFISEKCVTELMRFHVKSCEHYVPIH